MSTMTLKRGIEQRLREWFRDRAGRRDLSAWPFRQFERAGASPRLSSLKASWDRWSTTGWSFQRLGSGCAGSARQPEAVARNRRPAARLEDQWRASLRRAGTALGSGSMRRARARPQARPIGDAIRRPSRRGAVLSFPLRRTRGRLGDAPTTRLPPSTGLRRCAHWSSIDPDAIVLVAGELWPNLIWTAADRGVRRAGLRPARPGSSQLERPARVPRRAGTAASSRDRRRERTRRACCSTSACRGKRWP